MTAAAALVRLPALNRPVGFVFDEVFYAQNACRYVLESSTCGIDQLASRAHPPLGNWMIGLGIRALGYTEVGWRIVPAISGVIAAVLLYVLVRHLLRAAPGASATAGAFAASGLLAIDFLHVAQSRVAMLDVMVTTFVIAALLFATLDRDRLRPAPWERRPGGWLTRAAAGRPWRLLAGVAVGCAAAVKWSGAYAALAVIALVVASEVAARRHDIDPAAGIAVERGWAAAARRAVREEALRTALLLGAVPLVVYLATYIGRVPGDALTWPWLEGSWWRNVWDHQQSMLAFHTTLAGNHPYESAPWSWLLLKRPVAFFFVDEGSTYREILAIGNPLAWGAALLATAWLTIGWLRGGIGVGRAFAPELPLLAGAAATYLPWLILSGARAQVFLWYILPTIPFLYGALGVAVASAWHTARGRVAAGAFAAATLALFVFFAPLLVALPLDPGAWRARIWASDCDRRDAPALQLPDDNAESGLPPDGWCWI